MKTLALALAALVGLIHVYILILEMFLWTSPRGRAAFGFTPEFAESTKVLGANQGLYNGFLAAGIGWGLVAPATLQKPVLTFFLSCVLVAGVYGALTASRRILFVQAAPALVALLALWASG